MHKQITVPITFARKNLYTISDEVQKPGVSYAFTVNGVTKMIVVSPEDFEAWMETLEVVRDFPSLSKEANEARREYKAGKYLTLEAFVNPKKSTGKIKVKTHAIHSRVAKKSSKRTR